VSNSAAIDAARSFLTTVWDGPPPDDAALAAALDSLLASYHRTSEARPSDSETEPLREDRPLVASEVAARFPGYGYYPVADPTASPAEAAKTGDAIDDLLDLTLCMRQVSWRAENLGIDDAAWYFRLDYFHWGRHARELALYLHARQFG
jgi:hypothetical protein